MGEWKRSCMGKLFGGVCMPVISFDFKDFLNLYGSFISAEDCANHLPMIGGDFDKMEGDEFHIEFFPNRPDMTSVEGVARAARCFFGVEKGLRSYETTPSDAVCMIDASVKEVRPNIVMGIVRGVEMDDALVKSLMGLQEKLHIGLGRNRKKLAIGVHNLDVVSAPFRYIAVDPDAVSFVPLAKEECMTLSQILKHHEKGQAYADLLEEMKLHPLIVDEHNHVISYPPVINGKLTEVTSDTKNILVDVTGWDEQAVNSALNIVVTALADRGGRIETVKMLDDRGEKCTPNLSPVSWSVHPDQVNQVLGLSLSIEEMITCLGRMGCDATLKDEVLDVLVPAWRSDILHERDLIEDIAIGYGYDAFEPELPHMETIGGRLPRNKDIDLLRKTLVGLGFNEVSTMMVSNKMDEFVHMGLEESKIVEFANPIGEEYAVLRVGLVPSLLRILRENRHHTLPQQIFEVGTVVEGVSAKNAWCVAGLRCDAKAGFTQSKSIVEAVLRELNVKYSVVAGSHPGFIPGRCGKVLVDDGKTVLGFFGELHPKTILAFSLEHPVIGFELGLPWL